MITRFCQVTILVVALIALSGCDRGSPTPALNVEATVQASVAATVEAGQPATDASSPNPLPVQVVPTATSEPGLGSPTAIVPPTTTPTLFVTPVVRMTPIPNPTRTPQPTRTPRPTFTPGPTPVPLAFLKDILIDSSDLVGTWSADAPVSLETANGWDVSFRRIPIPNSCGVVIIGHVIVGFGERYSQIWCMSRVRIRRRSC